MIHQLGQVMLYVNDQKKALAFWTEKLNFTKISEEENEVMRWIEIAPQSGKGSHIIIHHKETVAKMSPELHLGTPSLMFFAENVENLYEEFKKKQIIVGEMVEMPSGKIFNFADDEENYFAVMEVKDSN
ncbi:VOC family protein [Alkalihalobacillus pseudalcaliphilus]|uniref:VOC family protein n=1 Tax=Alkalihalobacillus pseudalcaliphilus TaxID=79884 RepID=UPI00064DCAF7|nr:VOC family protein [Alkalihalobacillus pseudalcaliphilus]KMK77736.1 glyoxalase [Alkalihalobacillus pseudalcaliphilus]